MFEASGSLVRSIVFCGGLPGVLAVSVLGKGPKRSSRSRRKQRRGLDKAGRSNSR